MKTIYKYLFLSAFALPFLGGCSFLDVETKGKSDTDTFFADMNGLKTAEVGLYNMAFSFYDDYFCKFGDVAGDGLQSALTGSRSDMSDVYNFTSLPDMDATAVALLWKRGANVVINANTILNYSNELKKKYPNSVGEIQRIEAVALYFRALAHFNLVLCYAQPYGFTADASHLGVPYADHVLGTDERIARSSVADVYGRVIADIQAAQEVLGGGVPDDANYVSGMACDALLARVYLHMGNYPQAEVYATKVISQEVTTGAHTFFLTPNADYAAMFTGEQKGQEAILRLSSFYAGKSLRNFYDYESPSYNPTSDYETLFDAADVRRTLLVGKDNSLSCMKYYDLVTGTAPDDRRYHVTVSRLSEIYLIRAEARCRQNDLTNADKDLRKIMARAMDVDESSILLNYNGSDELMELIKNERNKELGFEGFRFFDLARWGDNIVRPMTTNSSMKQLNYPDYRFALPISQIEMDANEAMVQNEGY